MKPNKDLVFCHGCMRTKMLFESQSKADNFIKYNRDEILEEKRLRHIDSFVKEHPLQLPSGDVGKLFSQEISRGLKK